MVDQAYLSWPHALVSGGALRTPLERAADVFDVRDYYRAADGADWRPAIQRAIDATTGGGTIYFTPGTYSLNSGKLVLPDDHAARRFIGSGSDATIIYGNFDDYLLYCAQKATGNKPVALIDGIKFKNDYALAKASFTTPDPINQPGGSATGACGGIYLPNSSWVAIINCDFDINSGVALYMPGIANSIKTFNISMSFGGQFTDPVSIGIWGVGSIDSGKILGARYGIVNIQNIGVIQSMDIERCQVSIRFGNPYPFWDRNLNAILPANSSDASAILQTLNAIQFENAGSISEGGAFIDLTQCTSATLRNIKCSSFNQLGVFMPEYGFKLGGTSHCRFENCEATGYYSIAAIGYAGGGASSNIFKSVTGAATGGGVAWLLPTSPITDSYTPDVFLNTYPTDGGLTLANLPSVSAFNATAVCTDSTLPAYTVGGTPVSNIGKPVVGGGTYRVAVRYGTVAPTIAAAAAWAGPSPGPASTTITMGIANPSGVVVAGMGVWDVTTGLYIGKVLNYASTTLTLAAGAASPSAGSADKLIFGSWCIAG